MSFSDISFPDNTKFLVTGGAGFIGSNIVEYLLSKNYYVTVLDNFITGKLQNIDNFLTLPNFKLIEGDIRDLYICRKACNEIDYVLHQAALGSVPRSIKEPLLYEEINIKGTLNMLIAAKENNVKRFVYASSSSVYGDNKTLPKTEDLVGTPLSPYALTKKVNEYYGYLFNSLYNLETIGLRYFNVFGKRQDANSSYSAVIPKFIKSMLSGTTPIINGDGNYSRDFTYVDNVIEANLRACISPKHSCGKFYNIGCSDTVTLNKLYSTIAKLLDYDKPVIYGPIREGDIPHSFADISKAKSLLKYNPNYSFEDGIKLTIEWYKNNL